MNEWTTVILMLIMFLQGIVVGYLIWAPSSPVKEGFMNGLTFGLAWKRKRFKYAPLWTSSKIRLKDGGELRDQTPPPAHNSMWTGSEIRRENVEKNK